MRSLLVFSADDSLFSREEIEVILSGIEGVRDLRVGDLIGSVLDCEYERDGHRTIVRLSDDLRTLTMSNVSDASIEMALRLQTGLGRPLRAVDSSYSFDVELGAVASVEDFWRAAQGSV